MTKDLITVATCQLAPEAESIKLLLEQEGVEAFIADSNTVNVNWFLAPAVGYIKVQVLPAQEAAAREILREHPKATGAASRSEDDAPGTCLACGQPMPEDADVCPHCGWTFKTTQDDASPPPTA